MSGMAKVILLGNFVADPVKKYLDNGTAVTNFAIAVNEPRKGSNNERIDQVSYFDCVAFSKHAENIAQHMEKGRLILIEGRLRQRRWKAPDGTNRAKVEVWVDFPRFLGTKPKADQDVSPEDEIPPELTSKDIPGGAEAPAEAEAKDDDVPE